MMKYRMTDEYFQGCNSDAVCDKTLTHFRMTVKLYS